MTVRQRRRQAEVAPGIISVNDEQPAPKGWRWGPHFDGGDWLIQEAYGRPWAFRIASKADVPLNPEFGRTLNDVIWQLEHPGIIAALVDAEPTTRTYPGPDQIRPGIPDSIADDLADLNSQARDTLG